jgi:glycosyltransferase involved in cell wall biosynthesis
MVADRGSRRTIFINGRFLTQNTTGVQRMGVNLLLALDARLARDPPDDRWVVLCPAGSSVPPLRFIEASISRIALPPHLWQQVVLPLRAIGGLLLSLNGSAPWFASRQACIIHDAAVFDHPGAYTAAFRCWYRALFGHLARHSRAVVTVSQFSAARLLHHLPQLHGRLAVVPNGSDHLAQVVPRPEALGRWALAKDRYLLAVGCQNRLKNVGRLVEAVRSVKAAEGFALVVVGGGNARVFAPDAVPDGADHPIGVIPTGTVDDPTLKALYENALALVFPSVYEGFGLPPVEAMRCGCPVAASDAAAMAEVCGDAALYFDALDEASIARAMQRMVDEPGLRDELRRRGRARVAAMSWAEAASLLMIELERRGLLFQPGAAKVKSPGDALT